MLLGFVVAAVLVNNQNLWLAALVALILSPTDAALGQAVVTSERLPERMRQAINVESGLNDGIALAPILMCIAALSGGEHAGHGSGSWLFFVVRQLTLGPVAGILVGWCGGRLVEAASQRGWMQPTFQRLVAGSLAVIAYTVAEQFHGNGFIAAYCAGLFLGTQTHEVRERIQEFGEAEGQQMSLFVFLLFGLAMVPAMVGYWDVWALCYAILSLTVIRMVPVALSLHRRRPRYPGGLDDSMVRPARHRLRPVCAYGYSPNWRHRIRKRIRRDNPDRAAEYFLARRIGCSSDSLFLPLSFKRDLMKIVSQLQDNALNSKNRLFQ